MDGRAAPILKADALCAGVFGRERVAELVERWTTAAAAPAQVIGALYVFETYHAELGRTLADAAARSQRHAPERHLVGR